MSVREGVGEEEAVVGGTSGGALDLMGCCLGSEWASWAIEQETIVRTCTVV